MSDRNPALPRNGSLNTRLAVANSAPTRSTFPISFPASSDAHGLPMKSDEFNSLDAQREACEAYIVSQRHAGWVMLPDMYDDGGLSSGTMERPVLKRLLKEIAASKVT